MNAARQSLIECRDAKARDVTKYDGAHTPLSVALAEDVISMADALREIAELPEPMNSLRAAQAQCAWLKTLAAKALVR